MPAAYPHLVAWIHPSQKQLLKDVVKEAKVKLVAVGSSNIDDATELSSALKIDKCDDIRSMATNFQDAFFLISEAGSYEHSLCELLRHRAKPTITTTPLSGEINLLMDEAGKTPAAKFVPLMRRSIGFGQILDETDQFGMPAAAHCSLLCAEHEGTLWSRLFDAMDFIDHYLGTPDLVHAFHSGGTIPEEPNKLRGNMTVQLRFGDQRCATLLLSDQSHWKREVLVLGNDHTVTVDDGTTSLASLIASGITEEQPEHSADAPRILALCESARLSCITGNSEQPSKVLGMFH
ncbi:MAG: hypothetical protein QGI78_05335 [Phycisphaerales bacterium]|jgi:hypothetical protein|nr:hypothetical protein [Phycisphaerales bacterium]